MPQCLPHMSEFVIAFCLNGWTQPSLCSAQSNLLSNTAFAADHRSFEGHRSWVEFPAESTSSKFIASCWCRVSPTCKGQASRLEGSRNSWDPPRAISSNLASSGRSLSLLASQPWGPATRLHSEHTRLTTASHLHLMTGVRMALLIVPPGQKPPSIWPRSQHSMTLPSLTGLPKDLCQHGSQ